MEARSLTPAELDPVVIRDPRNAERGSDRSTPISAVRPENRRFDRVAVGQLSSAMEPAQSQPLGRPRLPGLLLGIGLGGFVDGIVFHQILQWHHMLGNDGDYPTTTIGGLEDNTLADGMFHAATWLAVVAGIWICGDEQLTGAG